MSKMKKYLLTGISYVLVATLAIGGTFAYLQDTDDDVNVMTLGNVQIEQIEQEWNADQTQLVDFTQGKPLYPYVGAFGWENSTADGGAYRRFTMENVVDKYVSVKNTGKTDAYVRTIIALEMGDYTYNEFNVVGISHNKFDGAEFKFDGAWDWTDDFVAQIDGKNYNIMVAVHKDPVKPGETTIPSLMQVYLSKDATNEVVEKLDGNKNGTYDILVLSQAVQAAGFENAKTALDTAFGASATEAATWFGGMRVPTDGTLPDNANVEYNGTTYEDIYAAVAAANANGGGEINLKGSAMLDKPVQIAADITINGANSKYSREGSKARAAVYAGELFKVADGATLELKGIVVDGGAVWTGEVNETLQRGTDNSGVAATGALVTAGNNSTIILGEGAVLQNNGGAYAVNLPKSSGSKLIVNGGQIINNTSAAGAIWGGGAIEFNSGKISYNHATSLGGAIRVVSTMGSFTMNGGEMNHNYSNGTGGAIWGGNNASYYLNGGEMAYNAAASAGGAIWTGAYEKYYISGDFKLHDNSCGENIGGAIRFADHASLTMTGGSVYGNKANGQSNAFYLNNNSATITGGAIADNFSYSGGLGLTWGDADVDGVVAFSLATNHNTAYLAETFGTLKFTVNENATNFAQFNFKPAAGYTYTAGDEAKLICMNEGYETYWDAATSTFRLQAK